MAVSERKLRQRAERERRIVEAAAAIAEADGWEAVTIRRLADAIEYSQPVLYSHFANRDAIVAAVAVDGFREIAALLRKAVAGSRTADEAVRRVAGAYLDFAGTRQALYRAMFVLPTALRFAEEDTQAELREAFDALAAVIAPGRGEVGLRAEMFWSALHGMAELERAGRIKPGDREKRVALLSSMLASR